MSAYREVGMSALIRGVKPPAFGAAVPHYGVNTTPTAPEPNRAVPVPQSLYETDDIAVCSITGYYV